MAVDRGGLKYPIQATDEFTKTFKAFEDGIRKIKGTLGTLGTQTNKNATANNKLKTSLTGIGRETANITQKVISLNRANQAKIRIDKSLLKVTKERARATRSEANAQERLSAANARFTQSIRNRFRDESRILAVTKSLADATRDLSQVTNRRIRENRVESATIRQKVRLLERELTLKRQLGRIRTALTGTAATTTPTGAGRTTAATAAPLGVAPAARGVQNLNKNLQQTQSLANRISFTFRRLFGILAAFAAVRALITGFRSLVTEGIRFTARIEDAKLGIASLLIAVSDVNDATGATADTADRLALAQREAARQTELLRKDALETSATFDQLLETFQVAIAPGFTAGLAVDQIRKFTVQISQAAQAIGLPQNQLAEEIRSILSGTIQARTTRIAVSLGITNEDIRRAKEAGKVFEFLQAKFKTFEVAGQESLKNFNVILSNVRDGILGIISAGFTGSQSLPGFFDTLKRELIEVNKQLADTSQAEIRFNPELIEIVRAIGNGLRNVVLSAKELVLNLGSARLLSIAQAIGNSFTFAAGAASILAEALTKNVALITDLANGAAQVASNLSGIAPDAVESGFRKALVIILQIAAATTLLRLTWSGLLLTFNGVKAVLTAILTIIGGLVTPIFFIVSNLGGIAGTLKAIKVAALAVLLPFTKITVAIGIAIGLVFLWEKGVKSLVKAVTGVELKFTSIAKILGTSIIFGINKATLKIQKFSTLIDRFFADSSRRKGLNKELEKIDRQLEAIENKQTLDIDQILDDDAQGKDLKDIFVDIGKVASDGFNAVFGSIGEATEEAKTFADVLKSLPPIILNAVKPLDAQADALKEIKQSAIEANDELELAEKTIGLTGVAAKQVELAFKGQVEIREATAAISKQEIDQQNAIANAISLRAGALKEIEVSETKIQTKVNQLLAVAEEERIQKDKINKLELERNNNIAALTLETDTKKKANLQKLINLQQQLIDLELKELDFIQRGANAFQANLNPEEFEKVKRIFEALVKSQGIQRASEKNLAELKKQRLGIELDLLQATTDQIQAEALRSTQELKNQNKELTADLEAEKAKAAEEATEPSVNLSPEQTKALQAEINLLIVKREILLENAKIEQEAFRKRIIEAQRLTIVGPSPAVQANQDLLAASIENTRIQEELLNEEIKRVNDQLALTAEIAAAGPFETLAIGAREAFKQVAKEVENTFLIIKEIITDTINSTSRFIADAIVDAFDPTNKTSLKEKFARFLQEIAKEVIAVLVKIAIVKSILGLGALLGGGAAEGGEVGKDVGLRKGGPVPRRGKASPAHFFAPQGHAEGGAALRPKGLDPRDTVPIWTQPGEYIMRKSSVLRYGADVMSQINDGLMDASTLRALAGAHRAHTSHRSSGRRGYAEGGVVTPSLRSRDRQPQGGVGIAAVISSEKEFDRLIAGGDESLIRWIGKNRNKIRPLLSDKR